MLINVDGIAYFVKIDGKEGAPPVVLLHGFTGDHTTWKGLTETLKDKFLVVAIDLLGHGKTDSPNQPEMYEMDKAAEHINLLLDRLQIDRAHFLGYSMGGRLALGFSITYSDRIRSLMLESSSPGLKTAMEKEARVQSDDALAAKILEKGMKSFVNFWEGIPLFQSQKRLSSEIREQIRSQRLKNDPIGLANSLKGFGTGRQPAFWHGLEKLNIPVLLICGELDGKFRKIAEEMNRILPESKMKEIKNAGHAIHVEEPDKFDTIVKEFLVEQEHLS